MKLKEESLLFFLFGLLVGGTVFLAHEVVSDEVDGVGRSKLHKVVPLLGNLSEGLQDDGNDSGIEILSSGHAFEILSLSYK